jgi:hypothetical protein
MGVISHISSFWGYRFKGGGANLPTSEEFLQILIEFETGLAPRQPYSQPW